MEARRSERFCTRGSDTAGGGMPDDLHPRHIAIRLVQIVAVIAVVVIAISALPGLDEVRARLRHANAFWVVAWRSPRWDRAPAICSSSARPSARGCRGA